jgi:hypothetical protein
MVRETRISPGPASAATRAPVCTAMPPDLGCGAVFHLAGVHPGSDLQAKVEKLQEQIAAAMDVALPTSCRAEALARDADRNHPDEVLGFGLYPRLKANVADRRTLGLGIHVMRRAPH